MTLKKCNQEGCDNSTDWVNRDTPRYSKGGYFRARCTSCSNLLSSYGINTVERDALLAEQDYSCLICRCFITFKGSSNQSGMANNAAVDHCHTSGIVRGILCMQCNLDLGKFETLKPKFDLFSKYIKEYGE
jgi:hypothetical protein